MAKRFLRDEQFSLPKAEERVLSFWKEHHIFERSLAERKGKKSFVFYEGPPYANGKPGIHHVLARIYKDIILRYKSMRGFYVPRRAGWDTHGLPVEIAAEKALGLKTKSDIERFGVKLFNEKAREAVWVYKDEWEKLTERIGYWLDLKNAYVTYRTQYIESIWAILKRIWERKLLFKGHKVVPWCTRCGTSLSSHELAQGYKEVEDASVYVKFKLHPGQKIESHTTDGHTYILSWTTTPWTLPGNVALAVGKDINYIQATIDSSDVPQFKKGETIIFARGADKNIFGNVLGYGPHPHEGDLSWANVNYLGKGNVVLSGVDGFLGSDLIGLSYEPLFDVKTLHGETSYKVYDADFVTTTDGTGVVHTAVMYGEDDYALGKSVHLPQRHTVDEMGRFLPEVHGLAGMYVKDSQTEAAIFDHLANAGLLFAKALYTHEYPFCWRCNTPVLYYARTSWFIGMSSLRKDLAKRNAGIAWVPGYLKDGRFGEWIREAKDWNLSRERYWGAPLPVWVCESCEHTDVIGSVDELAERAVPAKNAYWIMRHGHAETLIGHIIDDGTGQYHLTPTGQEQVTHSAEKLAKELSKRGERIDLIIASDVLRTKESAEIARPILGNPELVFDKRIREIHLGELGGCHDDRYHELFPTLQSRFEQRPEGGESLRDLRTRVWEFLQEIETKYEGKRILLVSHEYPIWMLNAVMQGWTEEASIMEKEHRGEDFVTPAELHAIPLRSIPRDGTGCIDLHRPFVDEVVLPCAKCSSAMRRIPEIADVWFDSGAMPFAQAHWPFEKGENGKLPSAYPAEYICEGMDQTRGWFYTLLAIATALDLPAPFKNVVSLGLINDKHGQKMSKSKGNIVEPWEVINQYGIDAVRWYFYTATPPGEPKNFDEAEVVKASRRFHMILYNSLVFYETYAARMPAGKHTASSHLLDQWIQARLTETIKAVTEALDRYEAREAALALERFVDDLSRWYIRRSRRRLQRGTDRADYEAASRTLGEVLEATIRLAAPFTPFFAESLYESFVHADGAPSVHMAEWPKPGRVPSKQAALIAGMERIRTYASAALAERAKLGIKVRQPLAALKIKTESADVKISEELIDILKDEVNVKDIQFDPHTTTDVEFDTVITPELRDEGVYRELARAIQELRQAADLNPKDRIALMLELAPDIRAVAERYEMSLTTDVGAGGIQYQRSEKCDAQSDTKIADTQAWIGIRKI